jgi:multicomponent Na+:H+ antiporter subunit D
LIASLATLLVGILGAVAQDDIKRMLSFTLVSHIGYMTFGIALGTVTGLSAAIFYVAHHIIIQTTLFLVAGLIERQAGSTAISELGGLAKVAPVLGVLFFVPAMNLAGIPPLSGFLGKVGLIQAGADVGTPLAYVLIAGSVVTSLLTLYAMSRVWSRAFWQATPAVYRSEVGEKAIEIEGDTGVTVLAGRPPRGMTVPTAGLVAVSLALTVAAGPLFALTGRAATDLLARTPYINSVLSGDRP